MSYSRRKRQFSSRCFQMQTFDDEKCEIMLIPVLTATFRVYPQDAAGSVSFVSSGQVKNKMHFQKKK